jgi:hypothetical protein
MDGINGCVCSAGSLSHGLPLAGSMTGAWTLSAGVPVVASDAAVNLSQHCPPDQPASLVQCAACCTVDLMMLRI